MKYYEVVEHILMIGGLPDYVARNLFTYTDVDRLKPRRNDKAAGRVMWGALMNLKRDITNVDNKSVECAIKRMPKGCVPSGGDIKLFYHVLVGE